MHAFHKLHNGFTVIPALLLELGQKKAELHWQQAKQMCVCVCACDKTQNPAKLNEEVAKLICGLFYVPRATLASVFLM